MLEKKCEREIRKASNSLLMRNNVGAAFDQRGVPIRYGLMNTSKQMNQKIKSSDLIGVCPILITPSDVGKVLGVFLAVETKKEGWVYKGDPREAAQMEFIRLIKSYGGFAGFATTPSDYQQITLHREIKL